MAATIKSLKMDVASARKRADSAEKERDSAEIVHTYIVTYWRDRAVNAEMTAGRQGTALLHEDAKLDRYRTALVDCIRTARELRRYISPDHGCGYPTYARIWDASIEAEAAAITTMAELEDQ